MPNRSKTVQRSTHTVAIHILGSALICVNLSLLGGEGDIVHFRIVGGVNLGDSLGTANIKEENLFVGGN